MATDAESAVIDVLVEGTVLYTGKEVMEANTETVEEDIKTAVVAIPVETRDRGGRKPKRYTTVTLLLHCCQTTLLLHSCHTAGTPLLHCRYNVFRPKPKPDTSRELWFGGTLALLALSCYYHYPTYLEQGLSSMVNSLQHVYHYPL
jgi:hypothetical protein